jgi:hypothetical protein
MDGKIDNVNNRAQAANDACTNLHNSNKIDNEKHQDYLDLINLKRNDKLDALNERKDVVEERLDTPSDNEDITSQNNKRNRDTDSSDSEDNAGSKRPRNENNQSTIDYVLEQESLEMPSIFEQDGGD